MKRDPEHELDLQLDRLTRTLRDTGIPPERDLWPEIDRAIDQADRSRPARSRGPATWRIVALAASVLLLVGVGLVQQGGLPGKSSGHQANQAVDNTIGPLVGGDVDPATSMLTVDQALADLNQALADDPNNRSLSHLVLMIHKSRGNLIRNTARRLAAPGG